MVYDHRVIALIDMDCFYVQVEQRENKQLKGQPVVVVQHAGGGQPGMILAVSYEARDKGVKRGMLIAEAKSACPNLQVAFVPQGEHADKADIQKYRDASDEIFDLIQKVDPLIKIEKASVDECFLELDCLVDKRLAENATMCDSLDAFPTTFVANGQDHVIAREDNLKQWLELNCGVDEQQMRLACGAIITEEIRALILDKCEFHSSAGIANNKMLAKLICSRHKPRQQTVLAKDFVPQLFQNTEISDVRSLGGKYGAMLQEQLSIKTMDDLANVPYDLLMTYFPDNANWLHGLAHGIDNEPIRPRTAPLSVAVSKNFPGKRAIVTLEEMTKWVEGLCQELVKRLLADRQRYKRTATKLTFGYKTDGNYTKTLNLTSYDVENVIKIVWSAAKALNIASGADWSPAVFHISISASKFEEGVATKSKSITSWLSTETSDLTPEETDVEPPDIFDEGSSSTSAEKPQSSQSANATSSQSTSKVKLDEEGWQIFDESLLCDVENDEEMRQIPIEPNADFAYKDYSLVDESVLKELPQALRDEIQVARRMESLHRARENLPAKQETKTKSRKRRASPAKKKPDVSIKKFFAPNE